MLARGREIRRRYPPLPVDASPSGIPNIHQHKVSPFELVDKTKPGHRKIVALFLLDPEHPRFSTTDIPPQQAEWYEVAMQQAPETSLFRKLPAEIMKETTRQLPYLMPLEEAKKYRL